MLKINTNEDIFGCLLNTCSGMPYMWSFRHLIISLNSLNHLKKVMVILEWPLLIIDACLKLHLDLYSCFIVVFCYVWLHGLQLGFFSFLAQQGTHLNDRVETANKRANKILRNQWSTTCNTKCFHAPRGQIKIYIQNQGGHTAQQKRSRWNLCDVSLLKF